MAVSSNTSGTRQAIHSSGRNPGTTFDLDIIEAIVINRSAVERRAGILGKKRSVKKEWQAAWLLKAVTCIDLTTLSGDDTSGNVIRLCAKARQPIRKEMMTALGMSDTPLKVGATKSRCNLCVPQPYQNRQTSFRRLRHTNSGGICRFSSRSNHTRSKIKSNQGFGPGRSPGNRHCNQQGQSPYRRLEGSVSRSIGI